MENHKGTKKKSPGKYARLGLVVLALLLVMPVVLSAQEEREPGAEITNPESRTPNPALTEVETLKGENLLLKYDSLDKQLRLMAAQYAALQQQQGAILGELQTLEAEILKTRSLPLGAWSVNWPGKTVEKTETEAEKQESGEKPGEEK